MSRQSPGLHPIGPTIDAVVIDLARRTGRISLYHQLWKRAAEREGEGRGLRIIDGGRP